MSDERRQILEMLSNKQINIDEAERLMSALGRSSQAANDTGGAAKAPAKYLRVVVESEEGGRPTRVNVRVPMQLLRAGVKLAALIPVQARDQVNSALRENGLHFDINQIKPENLEELIDHLNELTVDVDDPQNKVKVFCE